MKKFKGALIITVDNNADYSELQSVGGSVEVYKGATLNAPVLAKVYRDNGYNVGEDGKLSTGVYVVLSANEIAYLKRLKPLLERGRVNMVDWHQNEDWLTKSVQYTIHECNTTHCLAGWIHIFEKENYFHMEAQEAGKILAPNLAKLFYSNNETLELLITTFFGDGN